MRKLDDDGPGMVGDAPRASGRDAATGDIHIMHRVNRLKEKVGGFRDGGPLRFDAAALTRAQASIAKAGEKFPLLAETEIKRLTLLCEVLAKGAPAAEPLRLISSTANNLQGAGGTVGYDLICRFGKSLRDFVDTLGHIGDAAIDPARLLVIRAHVDTLRVVMAGKISGDGGPTGRALAQALETAKTKLAGHDGMQ